MYNLSVCIRQVWLINKTSIRHLSIRRGKIMSSLQTLVQNYNTFTSSTANHEWWSNNKSIVLNIIIHNG